MRGRLTGVAVALVALAAAMQLPTTLAFYERAYAEAREEGVYLEYERWTPEESLLVRMWPAMANQLAARESDVAIDDAAPTSEVLDRPLFRVVALWWWMLPAVGVPWLFGLAHLWSRWSSEPGSCGAARIRHRPSLVAPSEQ